jgi:protein SCO1/2
MSLKSDCRWPRLKALTLFAALLLAAGCRSDSSPQAERQLTGNVNSYHLKGVILSTDAAHGEVTINSEAIPGFMDAMAMPYKLKDPGIIQDLHAGDHLTATLLVADDASLLDQIVVTMQAKPDYKPATQYHVPAAGDAVPDFHFMNQSGKLVSIEQFHGKTLLLTFIYTRCPLSDYCPRMSRNFAAINKALQGDPGLYARTHLLSISFDPAYDSPAVLRSYGGAYIADYTNSSFDHWSFAAPETADLKKVLDYFDVGATPEKDKTITHSLSTVLIGPDGKIVAWYPTNDWTVGDVLNDIKKAAAKKPA